MKLYNKLKRMKKNTKIGLATSATYIAASFALPAFANTDAVQPVNIDQITTVEQAETAYKEKLTEYAEDKKINLQEAGNLYNIIIKGRYLEGKTEQNTEEQIKQKQLGIKQQISNLESKKEELSAPIRELEEKITLENEELTDLEKKAGNEKIFKDYEKELKTIQKYTDELFNTYLPGLLAETNPKYNVNYPVEKKLTNPLEEAITPLIEKADQIFKTVYQKNNIEFLLQKNLTIYDLIVFRELINSKQEIKYTLKDYGTLKENKLASIQQLTQKKVLMEQENSPELNTLEEKLTLLKQELGAIDYTNLSSQFFLKKLTPFENYFEALKKRESFIEAYCDASRFWGRSVVLHEKRLDFNSNLSSYDFQEQVSNLKNLFNSEGFQVKVDDIKNPTRVKFPLWLTWPGSVAVVLLRDFILREYIIKREWDPWDVLDPILLAGILGPIAVDAIHPWVYPFRTFLMPLITEPARKIFGWSEPLR